MNTIEATTINLQKPGDLNLVYRSVLNGWNVPQHVREQIVDQMNKLDLDSKTYSPGTNRGAMRTIKLVRLWILMGLRNDVDDGLRKSIHPFGRKRYPEKRRRRRSSIERRAINQARLVRLLEKLRRNSAALAANT